MILGLIHQCAAAAADATTNRMVCIRIYISLSYLTFQCNKYIYVYGIIDNSHTSRIQFTINI